MKLGFVLFPIEFKIPSGLVVFHVYTSLLQDVYGTQIYSRVATNWERVWTETFFSLPLHEIVLEV